MKRRGNECRTEKATPETRRAVWSTGTEEKVWERMRRAVLRTLSDAEVEALEAYVLRQDHDSQAEPNAEQKAVLDLCEQRYRELETTGTLVVNGRMENMSLEQW